MEREIRSLEERARRAILKGDLAELDRLWSGGFVVNAPDSRLKTKSQVLDEVRRGEIIYSSFERAVEHVGVRDGVAISMGSETVVSGGKGPDAGSTIRRRYTHVWVKEGEAWRIGARHASIVPE